MALIENIKCLVRDCENRKGQGEFIGDLCAPCYYVLTGKEVKPYSVAAVRIRSSTWLKARRVGDK